MQNKNYETDTIIEQNNIDVFKYGFVISENQDGIVSYEKRIADMIICLIDCSGMFTLFFWQNETKTYVANRYIVETQEQLDFLILNGRIGWIFKQVPM